MTSAAPNTASGSADIYKTPTSTPMEKEHNLVGDERDRILWYSGCAQVVE